METIKLPAPLFDGGLTVMEALKERRTVREFSNKQIPAQVVSNLLWAAFGVNREKGPFGTPGRTAASASNSQEIDLYIALPEGIYLYEAAPHSLAPVIAGDMRILATAEGQGKAGANAPLRIIYVTDIEKYKKAGFQEPGLKDPETQKSYYYVATGLIAGNVAVFAASQGMNAWFHHCNRKEISEKLGLRPAQRPLFAQSVGYPA